MLRCCSIHLSDCFCGNIAFTTCCFEFSLEHVLLAKLTMLHGIVVALCHTILGHLLPAKLITLHDIVVGRGQGQGLDLGWSWGWAFSFLCFDIAKCAHGKAYAKQVRIMCVLSVPLLDQVQGVPKMGSRTSWLRARTWLSSWSRASLDLARTWSGACTWLRSWSTTRIKDQEPDIF